MGLHCRDGDDPRRCRSRADQYNARRTMRPRIAASVVAIVVAFIVSASIVQKPLGSTPVVVELFTSQGCSSCPPADDLIRDLARDPSLRGKVIPLAFHVD